MPTGAEILTRAGVLLQDEDHVRWTLTELCDWLNEAQRAIALAKPSVYSASRVVTLAVGTLQSVPAVGSPTPLALISIIRNLRTSANSPRVGGRAIRPVNRSLLDAQEPNWHDERYVTRTKEARHFFFDEESPLEFYVYPGNDGTGFVEAVTSNLPTALTATGDVEVIGSYATTLVLPEPYSVPLLDYVLFRAHGKDALEGSPGLSQQHYQLFAAAVGLKIQVERATSPNAKKST